MEIKDFIPKGEQNKITSAEISKLTNLSTPMIRRLVNTARANFVPIASDSEGYFIAETPEDLNHAIAHINSRIHKMIQAREGLKKAQKIMEENLNV
jgi:hypothetical protein